VGYDYVEDVARAFVRAALETPPGASVVDLPGERASPEEFIAAIDAAAPGSGATLAVDGPAIASNVPTQPNFISTLFPDWEATPLAEGVRRTVNFYRARMPAGEDPP
jgi:nucleoside-diphosphate-sugar epimerase